MEFFRLFSTAHFLRIAMIRKFIKFPLLAMASILVFAALETSAQSQEDKDLAVQLVEIADEIMRTTRAEDQARDNYEQAADLDPTNVRANYMAGYYRLHTVHKGLASKFFERVKELNPDYRFEIDYLIGHSYHFGLEFEKAIEHYMLYEGKLSQEPDYRGMGYVSAEEVSRRIEECNIGIELLKTPLEKAIINLGDNVNSEYDDFAPVFNADESIIVFTSRRREDNQNENVDDDNMPYEDIYYSYRNEAGDGWDAAVNLGDDINTPFHDSILVMSPDGLQLYIYKEDNNGDIFVSEQNPRTELWSDPVPISSNINTPLGTEHSLTLSQDGNFMIFASNKSGGEGDFDLYTSTKDSNGDWSKPVNMGKTINTPYAEDGPFLDYDDKTLYFSSEGHAGMGGFDIYRTV